MAAPRPRDDTGLLARARPWCRLRPPALPGAASALRRAPERALPRLRRVSSSLVRSPERARSPGFRRSRTLSRSGRPSGLRHVSRLKLLTAFFLMGCLGFGLVLFTLVITTADRSIERSRVDTSLRRQLDAARQLIAVDPTTGRPDVHALAAARTLRAGYPQLYVVDLPPPGPPPSGGRGGPTAAMALGPPTPYWPGVESDVVETAVEAGEHGSGAPYAVHARARRIPPSDGVEHVRVMAWAVDGPEGEPVAAVVGVAGLSPADASHQRLMAFMWWTTGTVVVGGLVVASVMARGRFWLVDRALERHERFLHDTAHELRTPIASLRAIVGSGLAGDVPPEQALRRAMRVIQGTDEVIDDLMTLTRIETGREALAAEPVRLDLLVEALASQRTDDPPVRVQAEPTVVSANAELMRRAIGNLIENAVRHGRAANGVAEVVVDVADGRVTVTDCGPGVAPQLLPHVLDRISTGRQRTGSGLGLAIAGWVARIHGGQLTATNNRNAPGAIFTLHLPT